MASKSSKTIPFLAMIIVTLTMGAEAYFQIDIDLETMLPFFIALGITGGGIEAIKQASKARQSIPPAIQKIIDEELEKLIKKVKESPNS